MRSVDGDVMSLGDFNLYMGRHIDGFDGVHRGCGAGKNNLQGRMLFKL